ncbi:MAG: arylesterase [Candidatus Eiseniibacteriota bacterium]
MLGAWFFNGLATLGLVLGLALAPAAPAAAKNPIHILAFGDSLTAGYGLPTDEAFPTRLQAALRAKGIDAVVDNAGVSGDTTAGGLARLDWTLSGSKARLAIVELGANDGLRGLDPAETRKNLDAILTRLKAAGVRVLLTGMMAPPNLGRDYGREFNAIFPDLAAKHRVAFYPFFLDGVAANPALNQGDGLHPNAEGVDIIVRRILPDVTRLVSDDG